jgi:hypothetical protein
MLYFTLVFHAIPAIRAQEKGGYPGGLAYKASRHSNEGLNLKDLPEGKGLIRTDTIDENVFFRRMNSRLEWLFHETNPSYRGPRVHWE